MKTANVKSRLDMVSEDEPASAVNMCEDICDFIQNKNLRHSSPSVPGSDDKVFWSTVHDVPTHGTSLFVVTEPPCLDRCGCFIP